MKQLILILILGLFALSAFSQDLIVTHKGDSLNCKITKEKSDFIYFTFKHKNEVRKTLLPVEDIATYSYNFWQTSELSTKDTKSTKNYKPFRFAINKGFSYRLAPTPENAPSHLKNYYKSLKSGLNIGIDANYFFSESSGFGIKANMFHSSASLTTNNKSVKEITQIYFIGPSFTSRLLNHNKSNAVISNFSIGYMGYNSSPKSISDFMITGNTIGAFLDLGYDIKISETMDLGFQLSLATGVLSSITIHNNNIKTKKTLPDNSKEGLGRIDFSFGLRF